jgi:SAM-dependent methyltransferase
MSNSPGTPSADSPVDAPARIGSTRAEVEANHEQLEARNAVHRRFGFDAEVGVQFVLEKALPLRGRVLGVGTGKRRFLKSLAKHAGQVTTVDINGEEQHCARMEAIYTGVADRIDFVVADARSLPWRAGSFDVVTTWNVVHHLDAPERVLREMLRVLRPGGWLVVADFTPSGFRLMDEIHAAEGRRHPNPPSPLPRWWHHLRRMGVRGAQISGISRGGAGGAGTRRRGFRQRRWPERRVGRMVRTSSCTGGVGRPMADLTRSQTKGRYDTEHEQAGRSNGSGRRLLQ